MSKLNVGEKAPDFTLDNQEGNPISLNEIKKESSVVLFFYPKDFSPGCTIQACSFRDSYENFTDLGARAHVNTNQVLNVIQKQTIIYSY